jgi:hypothetical protein
MGNINMKWLIIGGILVVLLIAFGKNPVAESRKRYEMSKQGKDPLIQSIEEYNSGKGSKGSFGSRRGGDTTYNPGATYPPNPAANPGIPSYMQRNDSPHITNPYQQPAQPQQPPVPDSYYPPPPSSNPTPTPENPFTPQSMIQQQLTNGKPVMFAGTEVYTKDSQGRVVPMPDGTYYMYDGRIPVIVKGGRHVVISN